MFRLPNKNNICTVSDLRKDPQGLIKRVEREEVIYVYNKSKIQVAMLSMGFFDKMMTLLEKMKDDTLERLLKGK
ncbi:MAG: hypothetical protein HYV39_02950 [Candidatus Levybacteria bacterium]|nr:hypothetical protein [Candidatus Levybacteria bacterium]